MLTAVLFLKYLFIWLHWVLIAVLGLSLVAGSGGYSLAVVCGLLTAVASRCRSQDLGLLGFSSFGLWALEHRLNSCGARA